MKEFARVLKPKGTVVFSVTHPDINWDGYVLSEQGRSGFSLSAHSDIYHHRFCDYFDAIDKSGLIIDRVVQVPVSARIRKYLTAESYRKVKGRFQVVIFRLRKPKAAK